MGEIADMMTDGTLCEGCGTYLGEFCGYPRRCEQCQPSKVSCPVCKRSVKSSGLNDHMRALHAKSKE